MASNSSKGTPQGAPQQQQQQQPAQQPAQQQAAQQQAPNLYATGPATQQAGGVWLYPAPWATAKGNPWGGASYAPKGVVQGTTRLGLGKVAPKAPGSRTAGRWAANVVPVAGVQGGCTANALYAAGVPHGDITWAVAHGELVLLPPA